MKERIFSYLSMNLLDSWPVSFLSFGAS